MKDAFFAEVAGFYQRVGVGQDAVSGKKFHIEMEVSRDFQKTERDIAPIAFQKAPASVAPQERAWMPGVADGEPSGGGEESCDDRGGEGAFSLQAEELLIEQPDEFALVQTIDEATHKRAQVGGGSGDYFTVTGYIGQE